MSLTAKIAVVAALVVMLAFAWLLIARANLAAELAAARGDAAALQIANDNFRDAARRQLIALNAIQAEEAGRAKQAAAAEQRAEANAKRYEAAARKLGATKLHGDACRDAERLIDLYRKQTP